MPSSVRVDGVDQLKVLARDLRRAGRTDLKIEFKKEINRFARDNSIKDKIHDSAMEMLPSGGGHKRKPRVRGKRKDGKPRVPRKRSKTRPLPLNKYVAKAKVKVAANLGGRNIGVAIIGSQSKKGKKVDLEGINSGTVRHKTFGRKPWHSQSVPPGFFDKPIEGPIAENFRRHIWAAVNNIRRQLESGAGRGGNRAA